MDELDISTEIVNGVVVVTIDGRIDSRSAPKFDESLKHFYQNGQIQLVIELSGVNYMSSAGLRVLVAARRDCSNAGGDVRLAAPAERVAEVLSLAGLDSIFQLFANKAAAIGSYQ